MGSRKEQSAQEMEAASAAGWRQGILTQQEPGTGRTVKSDKAGSWSKALVLAVTVDRH